MSEMLEAAARAVATATGYHYSGDSIIENAEDNPRSAHFVEVARAVINAVLPIEREACARVAEADTSFDMLQDFGMQSHSAQLRTNIAEAIRNRQ